MLGQTVTIREDGIERKVTAAEAFLLQLTKSGLEGDGAAARAAMTAIANARAASGRRTDQQFTIIWRVVNPGRVNSAMMVLKMARKLDAFRESARMALEPWIVQAAIDRLRPRSLSLDEQRTVVSATRARSVRRH